MASIHFFIQSKKDNSNIYVSFAPTGERHFKRKTRETINPIYWNAEVQRKGFPKNIHSGSKELIQDIQVLKEKLIALESFIYKQYNNRESDDIITPHWLEEVITVFYNNGEKINDLEYLKNYLPHYKQNILPFRLYRGQRISRRTVQKQSTIIDYLLEFVLKKNPKMRVSQYGKTTSNQFERFLREEKLLSDNTIGKYIKYSKTILKDAINENIKVNPQLNEIRGFTVPTPTVILTNEELDIIKDLKVLTDYLQISRDWLIIGCYTGQRAGDLFTMNSNMILNINGKEYINITQSKTGVTVKIPLHREVKNILDKRNGEFPPLYSDNIESNKTLFNKALKNICEIAQLDREVKGRVYVKSNEEDKGQFIHDVYPLYEVISSHVCRRTFATNNYKNGIPSQYIMSVTGHKTEREFLQYIGVDSSDLSKHMFEFWENIESKETTKKNPKTAQSL
ncbi:site-specific integrase [Weeksellaceae bacterium KMM 9713]|uniref:Site-specific integrase n=1 Tax=Profundicola chukchiensis TaxID=2961959 RepID=A0A9X4MZD9_9FLAO|nr:tyrosine-type recombinase/integrase [Profundicola chukchiensis]MDG4946849.1 site-specific integrase [Profundicola chukchiensis]